MGRDYWVAGGGCGCVSRWNMTFYVQITHFPQISFGQLELHDLGKSVYLIGEFTGQNYWGAGGVVAS